VIDAEGEVLQFRLGFLGAPGWQFLSTSITGEVEPGNRISPGNGRLDGALRLRELVLDDQPNEATGSGTIFVDDLVAFVGPEVYGERFGDGDAVVDVVWALGERTLQLPAVGSAGIVTERNGSSRTIRATDGQYTLAVGPSPVYLRQNAGE